MVKKENGLNNTVKRITISKGSYYPNPWGVSNENITDVPEQEGASEENKIVTRILHVDGEYKPGLGGVTEEQVREQFEEALEMMGKMLNDSE